MRKVLPESLVVPGHPDFPLLSRLADDLHSRAGPQGLKGFLGPMLRDVIDHVIETPRTGRRSFNELEKTEKTYIGTRVEIMIRAGLSLKRGTRLDVLVGDVETDIKHTMADNWSIPPEALGHPCLLVAADEARARCYLGLIIAHRDYLHGGKGNRDSKRGVSSAGFQNILWLLADQPYEPNFWQTVRADIVDHIFQGKTGNERVTRLFRQLPRVPINRKTIESVAQQKDFMRRLRADNNRGTRDALGREGILLLSSAYDSDLIKALSLPEGEFVSFQPSTAEEIEVVRNAGRSIR